MTDELDPKTRALFVETESGHLRPAHPKTIQLHDRRRHNPEKSASFFANY